MDQAQNDAQVQNNAPNVPQLLPVVPPAAQVPIVQAQVVPNPNGNMDLKIQQTKLPEFWGQKDKDSISANEFVKRVDKMMSANNWSDKVAFNNFGLALKGEANTWLDSQVMLKKTENDGPSSGLSSRRSLPQSQMTNSSWTVWPIWQCGEAKMSAAFSDV